MHWRIGKRDLDLSQQGMIMGILNVTPDSFSDGGWHADPVKALEHARNMIGEGAEIIDVGGESTRPGAEPVDGAGEMARTIPVVEALRAEWDGLISIDTMKAEVASAAVAAGADIINDVSGLRDPEMVSVAAASGCGVVVMHMQGEPRTMQEAPSYLDVVGEVRGFFEERLNRLESAGIRPEAICFDPGIGFGKSLEHNLELLRKLESLQIGDRPLMVGLSRKRFIGRLLDSDELGDRFWPGVALTAWTRERGARVHRVHDVRANRESLTMIESIAGIRR